MRVHFPHRNFRDSTIILEEGDFPHPQCPHCDILVPWKALNGRHTATAQCDKGEERKRHRLEEEEMWKRAASALQAYGSPLDTGTSFKYLGQVLKTSN